ncbi:hypothetical protein SprV_0200894700 [Sparganum proliferum]
MPACATNIFCSTGAVNLASAKDDADDDDDDDDDDDEEEEEEEEEEENEGQRAMHAPPDQHLLPPSNAAEDYTDAASLASVAAAGICPYSET